MLVAYLGGIFIYQFLLSSIEKEYDTVKVLKSGDRGTVTLLRHRATHAQFIFRQFTGSADVYQKLLGLSCPHLPQILEAASEGEQVAVLEEYIQGDSLDYLLRGSLFSQRETRQIGRQLCQGLWVLHSLGAVHRDVKPENVILRGNQAVLIDFDASRIVKLDDPGGVKLENEADTQVLDTTGFAAPEQYGIGQSDRRADIYSLGVLMNILCTGKHPSVELAKGRLGRIIQKCTMISPSSRYQSVAALMEAL